MVGNPEWGAGLPEANMLKTRNDHDYWLARAEETRTIAELMVSPDAKRAMLRIAEDYENLARQAEARKLQTASRSVTVDRRRTKQYR